MSLPDFELGVLEMLDVASSEKALAPASGQLLLEGNDILLRLCAGRHRQLHLFLRLNFPGSPVIRFESEASPWQKHFEPPVWKQGQYELKPPFADLHEVYPESYLASLVNYLLTEGRFSRLFALPSRSPGKPLALRWWRDEWAWSFGAGGIPFQLGNFAQSDMKQVLGTSDEQVLIRIKDALRDTDADCYFAWNWIQLEWREQERLLARFTNGNYEEMQFVLRCVTYLILGTEAVGIMAEWFVYLSPFVESYARDTSRPETFATFINHKPRLPATEILLDKWLDVIYRHFLPYYDVALEKYSIVKRIIRVHKGVSELYFDVPVPTQHERLEAHLQLRDWLKGKVAPDEIPFLLGEA